MNVHQFAICVLCVLLGANIHVESVRLISDDMPRVVANNAADSNGADSSRSARVHSRWNHHRRHAANRQVRVRDDDVQLLNITLPHEPITDEQKKMLSRAAFMMLRSNGNNDSSSRPQTISHSATDFLRFKQNKERCRTKGFRQVVEYDGCISKTIKLNLCIGQCKSVFIPKGMCFYMQDKSENSRDQLVLVCT